MIKKNSNLIQLIISYLLVLILPIILSLFAYTNYFKAYEKSMLALHYQTLNRNMSAVSEAFSSFERYVYQLSKNSTIDTIMNTEKAADLDIAILSKMQYIPSPYGFSQDARNYIKQRLIFFKNNDIWLNDSTLYYSSLWTQDYNIGGFTKSQWETFTNGVNGTQIISKFMLYNSLGSSGSEDTMLYCTTIPIDYKKGNKAVVVLFLDKNRLMQQLISGIDSEDIYVKVTDENGNLVLSSSDDVDIENVDEHIQTVFQVASPRNGWLYTWIVPKEYITSFTKHMLKISIASAVTLILVGIGISVILAYKRNKPVTEITDILKNSRGKNTVADPDSYNVFNFIKGSVKQLIEDRSNLETRLKQSKEFVMSSILDKLLKGKIVNPDTFYSMAEQIGFSVSKKGYVVIIIQLIDTLTEVEIMSNLQVQHSVLLSFINQISPDVVVHSIDINRIAIIINDTEDIEDYVDTLSKLLKHKDHTNVKIGIGKPCDDITELYLSFRAAIEAVESGKMIGSVVYSESIQKNVLGRLFYAIEDEQRIINLVQSGDSDECIKMLKKICVTNSSDSNQPSYILRLFVSELTATLLRILTNIDQDELGETGIDISELISELESIGLQEAFLKIEQCFIKLCRFYGSRKREAIDIVIDMIKVEIQESYMDQCITLTSIADKFKLSEVYLSSLFKKSTGENFSSYLERTRMNKAHALLTETDMPLENIAENIGYYSSDTFRKAFKRYHGITPSAYRTSTAVK